MNSIPVNEMDAAARSYFVHHRNQAEINKALMDLFRLVDFFLHSDESARDPLMSLRVVSEYMQRKGLVAPIPAELHDFYEQPTPETAHSNNPLFELARLITPIDVPSGDNTHPTPASHTIQSPSVNNNNHASHCPRTHSSSESSTPTAVSSCQESSQKHTFPEKNRWESNLDISFISSMREKVKAWLARPATQALRKWATRKAPSHPQLHEGALGEVYDPKETAVTRPRSPLLYCARVDTERVVKEDPLPIRHARNKPLPHAPTGHRRSNSFPGISSQKMASSTHDRCEKSDMMDVHGSTFDTRPDPPASFAPFPIPAITIQPPTPPNSTRQLYEPESPAGRTMSIEASLASPTPSSRSLSSSTSSHHVHRKPVPAYVGRPSTTTPSSPTRAIPTPSPLLHDTHHHSSAEPTRDEALHSRHQQRVERPAQISKGLGLSTNGTLRQNHGRMVPTRDDNPNNLSRPVDVSRRGHAQSLSSHRHPQTANGHHRRDGSLSSFVTSVAPSLSTVSENSHSGSELSEKEFGCQESRGHDDGGERVRRVVLPSGETLLLRGDDLEEWEMGEAIERAEQDARRKYTREIDFACGDGKEASAYGGILAEIAARRKPSIRSHGFISFSSQRSLR